MGKEQSVTITVSRRFILPAACCLSAFAGAAIAIMLGAGQPAADTPPKPQSPEVTSFTRHDGEWLDFHADKIYPEKLQAQIKLSKALEHMPMPVLAGAPSDGFVVVVTPSGAMFVVKESGSAKQVDVQREFDTLKDYDYRTGLLNEFKVKVDGDPNHPGYVNYIKQLREKLAK